MILTVNKTPGSLSQNSSEGYIGYRDLGPRPECFSCDAISDCNSCTDGTIFMYPVVAGDRLYFQFSFDDFVNSNVESPSAGWYSQNQSNYYIKATLQFNQSDDLVLDNTDEFNVIISASVGYYSGSFQNLILNSASIQAYIVDQGFETDCFRLLIQSYSEVVTGEFITVVFMGPAIPDHISPFWNDGDYIVAGAALYQLVDGSFEPVSNFTDGQIVFNTNTGLYYEYQQGATKEFVIVTPESTLQLYSECQGAWHKFDVCGNTVIIEGQHGTTDCRGHYYGVGSGSPAPLPYKDRYRIPAMLEFESVEHESEENEAGLITNLTVKEVHVLKIQDPGLPEVVIRRLYNSLYSSHFYVDNNEYIEPPDFEKNNPAGRYWWSQIPIKRLVCEKNSDCDEVVTYYPPVECESEACPTFEPVTINVNGDFYQSATSGEVVNIECAGPSGEDVVIHNSDDSFTDNAPCGTDYELEDITFAVYLDGTLNDTIVFPSAIDQTINIEY